MSGSDLAAREILRDPKFGAHADLICRAVLDGEPLRALNFARALAAAAQEAGITCHPEAILAAGAEVAKTATLPDDSGPDLAAPGRALAAQRLVASARAKLLPADPEALDYPAEALGPLAPAAAALAGEGQMPAAMAGQAMLGAAALMTQSHRDVLTLDGARPLSLYLLTVAESGEGKSTAENVALRPVREHQREESERYRAALLATDKGAAPPRHPYRIVADATVEGLRRSFSEGGPSQAMFTAEAAAVLCGHGMAPENKARTAAELCRLWDRGEFSVSRALAGRIELHGRRLAIHWQIQPLVARGALHDALLAQSGLWPRFLVAWPAVGAPRTARPFRPGDHQPIRDYWARARELLAPPREDCMGLACVELDPGAAGVICKFFERMEQQAKTEGGALEAVRPFAMRATELACRVAGVLAVFDGAERISERAMRDSCALVLHSVATWRSIFGDREEHEEARRAVRLFDWLARRANGSATENAMLRIGPHPLRSRALRDAALARLQQAGLVERDGFARDTWHVVGLDK
jgi:hypothetical protein